MREQNEYERELEFEINSLRMLMVMECVSEECAENRHFHQILPTPEQFKAVSDALCTPTTEPDEKGYHECMVNMAEEVLPVAPFDNMMQIDYRVS